MATDHKQLARQLEHSELLTGIFAKQRAALVERWAGAESIDEREDIHATYCATMEFEELLNDELIRIIAD